MAHRQNHPPARLVWTPASQRLFLAALLKCGNVTLAARAAGMSRSAAHRLRQRLAGTPFDRAWEHAVMLYHARVADPIGAVAMASPVRRDPAAPVSRG